MYRFIDADCLAKEENQAIQAVHIFFFKFFTLAEGQTKNLYVWNMCQNILLHRPAHVCTLGWLSATQPVVAHASQCRQSARPKTRKQQMSLQCVCCGYGQLQQSCIRVCMYLHGKTSSC